MKRGLFVIALCLFSLLANSQGTETFSNSGSVGSYTTVSWIGDNGLPWNATSTRTDLTMNGKCVVVRVGQISCNGIPNGIGSLSFKHQQFFTGSNPVLEVRINGVLIGSVSNITSSIQTATFSNINVTGAFNIEIRQTTTDLRVGIDDVTWTAYNGTPCVAPSSQPTNLVFGNIATTTADVNFTAASGSEKYLVVRSTSSTLIQQPVNGTLYSEGETLGNGVIAYSGSNQNFVASDLLSGTTYYFFVFSYNESNCSGGPTYNVTSPLNGSVTTTTPPACTSPTNNISNLQFTTSSSSVNGSFTSATGADGYLIVRSSSSSLGFTPSNGVVYNVGQTAGNGVVIKSGVGTTFNASGLTASTTYHFFVFPQNSFECSGGPLYNTISISGSATTTSTGSGDWPTGYYDFANGKTCATLKTALRQIVDNTSGSFPGDNYRHQPQSYDALKSQYKISDIKPREVGSGSANVIWDVYSDNPNGPDPYNFTPGTDECGNYNSEADCYNREHSFPGSWFSDASPMYSDYHHLFPTDGYVNNKRSSHKFGEVASATWTSLNGSKLGSSAVAGISGPVFEPINEYKGDLARAYLYMVTRYETLLPNWNNLGTAGAQTLDGTVFPGVDITYLKLMIKWHNQDPVSQKERDRNNGAYSFQGNRNPFVDHPQYVSEIWNAACPGLGALPVDILFFTGKLNGNNVTLNWEVANQVNLDRYEVERSFNGTSYQNIGTVKAEGKSSYNYTDNVENLGGRRVYYRLKKVDKDGKFSYSAVFTIHIPTNTKFSVYPNPASTEIRMQLNNSSTERATVLVTDISGRKLILKQVAANQGLISIPAAGLSNGSYIVKLITSNGEEYSQRVLIIK